MRQYRLVKAGGGRETARGLIDSEHSMLAQETTSHSRVAGDLVFSGCKETDNDLEISSINYRTKLQQGFEKE
jgi:hypothetical protein